MLLANPPRNRKHVIIAVKQRRKLRLRKILQLIEKSHNMKSKQDIVLLIPSKTFPGTLSAVGRE
jgi:hypothetical protein